MQKTNNTWGSLGWLSLKVLIVLYLMNSGVSPFIYQNF